MEKHGFVYIWRDRKHNRYYIGSHWGTEDDGYICSSRWMRNAYKRRPEDFKRKIISKVMTERGDLLAEEYKWLQLIPEEQLGNKYYNLTNHHNGHWTTDEEKTLTVREKISRSVRKSLQDPEVIARKERAYKKRDDKPSPETIEKRRQSMIKAMEKKFPPEQRRQRAKKGTPEHTTKLKEAASRRWSLPKDRLDEIQQKVIDTKRRNGTLSKSRDVNLGSVGLWKEGVPSYKKAKPGSDRFQQLLASGYLPRP